MLVFRACAYQGVINVSFSENFAYALNGWYHRPAIFTKRISKVAKLAYANKIRVQQFPVTCLKWLLTNCY